MDLRIPSAVLVGAMALALVGCESNDNKVTPGQNKITMSAAEAQAQGQTDYPPAFRSEEGSTVVAGTGPTEDMLGVPYYPGSVAVEKGGMITGSPEAQMFHSKRTSSSKPDKVMEWYKKNVKEIDTMSGNLLVFTINENKSGTIRVEEHEGGSLITIVTLTSKALPPLPTAPKDSKK